MKKTSMSFMTALSLSLNNLKTKKDKTIMTSFAGGIGASKRDISRVFNAETLGVAKLPIAGMAILVIISMGLTVIADIFPSRMVAKKDPVEALRTE